MTCGFGPRGPLTARTASRTLTPLARKPRMERVAPRGAQEERAALIAEIEVGAVIDGTVARITPYGAFLQLEDGRLGLVHISEVDRNYVKDVHDHLREGDVVQAKVVAIKEDGKIDLSIKALQDPAPPRARRGSDPEFEQMLKKFMRQSEERLVDYKRAVEHKRK
jgi:S1 RNA binding domain protein